ncbi:MAG: heavy metal translocating P-type ATPase [Myxococcota bacterium]|nr:heavy metal translocating P-type ATPase [Myxococcota bacterium]
MTGLGPEPGGVCFHCGLPIPRGISFAAEIGGEQRPVCCAGCRAVAELIAGSGLGAYYERRDGYARTPEPEDGADQAFLDEPALQRDFVRSDGDLREATLLVDGIRCAACAWLIDRHLGGQPGVESARVGLATRRLVVRWRPEATRLSTLCAELGRLGYRASPFLADAHDAQLRAEDRLALRRIGVAGLGTMQVMMFAVGLYAGAGAEPTYRDLLRLASWVVATVVVAYAARPFFEGALRDLRRGAPGMDVPVALAIGFAYAASSVATFRGAGEVYFDSACMFTFFLGLGRYAELRARRRSDERIRTLLHGVPDAACRLEADRETTVPARALEVGDTVLVRPGAIFPADGRVLEGASAANEALLTGEAAPQEKARGDLVIGGSQNIDAPLVVRVERVGADATASRIAALLERAQLERPPAVRAADRIARVFVSCVIAVAAVVGIAWWQMAPQDAPWVVLAVLVATCPCALSLATPAALASATNALARVGFLVTRGHVLETLARATHVVFDKTGTVTHAEPALARVVPLRGDPPAEVVALAGLLERGSAHPVATALRAHAGREPDVRQASERLHAEVADCEVAANRGVAGSFRGRRVRVGRPDWAVRVCDGQEAEGRTSPEPPEGRASWVLVADARGPLAWLGFESAIRPDAAAVTRWLGEQGISGILLSGDPSGAAVADVARALGFERFESGATPERKVDVVERLQAEGAVVAAVGDGVNDAPCMGRAQVSVAMGSGTDLTRLSADAILLSDRLDALRTAIRHAQRTRSVVRQNLSWAVLYNLCALPLAAAGFVQPWMAAVGMSASSLLVVANALRLGRLPIDTGSAPEPADGATATGPRLRGAEATVR